MGRAGAPRVRLADASARVRVIALACALTMVLGGARSIPGAAPAEPPGSAPPAITATFVYVSREASEDPRASLSEPVAPDYGWQGAKFGVSELNVNGRFVGGHFELTKITVATDEDLPARMRGVLRGRPALVVADLKPTDLLALADLPEAKDSVIVDARTSDDALRQARCRANVLHVLPSWDMRAYALSRFLVAKGWRRWLLLRGSADDDLAYADALQRAARAGGAVIVGQSSLPASGAESSLTQVQLDERLRTLTRTPAPYDVVLVTDASGIIGEQVMYRTAESRLVAGTQGLRATAWDYQFRDFAARGFGFRFAQFASREMGERDYGNWLAVTVLGEAALRGGVTAPADVEKYLLSSRFSVAAFKGEPLTFRRDDLQLRQPVLLFGPKVLVELAASEAHPATDVGSKPGADRADGAGEGATPCTHRASAAN
jgi:ABC transporter substrate binding protein (PQQ-dependent alcohol dehydrogenase system)